jgi:hypothetical protein
MPFVMKDFNASHRCSDCDVSNRHMVASEPFVLAQSGFQDARTPVELFRFSINCILVWFAFHERLDHIFD